MSDRELIVNFLEKAEKRAHFNKRFNDIAITLAIAFVVPVLFKLLDLFFLFRGRTVVTFLGTLGCRHSGLDRHTDCAARAR